MHTCSTGVPATSSTGTTLSGFGGLATSGPSSPRSISTRSSYSQPASGPISSKSSSRCWRAQPVARVLVGREHGRGGAQLGDHVGDRAALGHAQVRGARAGELEDLVLAAAHGQAPQQLEDHVLGLHPGPRERALEVHLHHLGAGDLVRVAAHGHRHVEAAGADRDHARARRWWWCASRRPPGSRPAARSARCARSGRCRCPGARSGSRTRGRAPGACGGRRGSCSRAGSRCGPRTGRRARPSRAARRAARTASAPSSRWRPGAGSGPPAARSASRACSSPSTRCSARIWRVRFSAIGDWILTRGAELPMRER